MHFQVIKAMPGVPVDVGDALSVEQAAELCEVNARDLLVTGLMTTYYWSPDGSIEFKMVRDPDDPVLPDPSEVDEWGRERWWQE
jgi:hypothetical protein